MSRGWLPREMVEAPALDPAAYDALCQHTPTAPDCGLPLYWPAPRMALSPRAGLHRFSWDMHLDPITKDTVQGSDDDAVEASISSAASVYESENLSFRNGSNAGKAPLAKSVPRWPAASAVIAPLLMPARTLQR